MKVHTFPFSAHTSGYSIPAGKFPDQIPETVKKTRLKTLVHTGNERRSIFLQANDGEKLHLLAERVSKENFSGWSENYIELGEKNFTPSHSGEILRGQIVE